MSESVAASSIALQQLQSSSESVYVVPANTADTNHVIGLIKQELQLLLHKDAALLKRIRLIRQTLVGLADIFGPAIVHEDLQHLLCKYHRHDGKRSHPGFTETCRRILMECSEPLTVRQVCERIRQDNPSLLARNKNPTASVAVVLKRLVSYGEALDGVNERDGRTWLWAGTLRRDAVNAD